MPGGTQIRIVTGDAFFERVVIPAQAWPINSKCNVAVRPLYTKISAHFRLGEPKGRIFLTRNQSTYKRIANLAEIERVATDLGFALVNPETLPIPCALSTQGLAVNQLPAAPLSHLVHRVGDILRRLAPDWS